MARRFMAFLLCFVMLGLNVPQVFATYTCRFTGEKMKACCCEPVEKVADENCADDSTQTPIRPTSIHEHSCGCCDVSVVDRTYSGRSASASSTTLISPPVKSMVPIALQSDTIQTLDTFFIRASSGDSASSPSCSTFLLNCVIRR